MKAAVIEAAGSPPAWETFPDPVPEPGEVLVDVTAAALCNLVRSRASGAHYSAVAAFPRVPGVDGVGRLRDGTRVYFVLPRAPWGSFAETVAVPAARTIPVPDDLHDVTAAAIANPGMSSWAALAERAHLAAGETVLVNGATGTAGRLAVQVARHLGAGRIIATGRNAAALASLGADGTVTLPPDDRAMEEAFRAVAHRVDIVLDYLWGQSARAILTAAARTLPESRRLRFVQIGAMSAPEIALPAAVLRAAQIELTGSGIGSVPQERLIACIRSLLHAAGPAGLRIDANPVPITEVGRVWAQADATRRPVFRLTA